MPPTAKALAKAESIRRFLEKPPPKKESALADYEREWNRSRLKAVSSSNEVSDADTTLLLAFGIETYRRLGWSIPHEALKREDQTLNLRAEEERPRNEALLWAKVHPASAKALAQTVPEALKGSAFAVLVIGEWTRTCSFDRALLPGRPAERSRKVFGEFLAGALSRAATKADRRRIAG